MKSVTAEKMIQQFTVFVVVTCFNWIVRGLEKEKLRKKKLLRKMSPKKVYLSIEGPEIAGGYPGPVRQ